MIPEAGINLAPPVETLAAVVAVVISSPGVPPSFFRTEVQLHNPFSEPITGRLVYHCAGISGGRGPCGAMRRAGILFG